MSVQGSDGLAGYVTTSEAQRRLGYRQHQTIAAKCRAYRKRLEAIRATGREPTAAEREPQHPRELACEWLGEGPTYLVEESQLARFLDRHSRRGRPFGA